MVDGQTGSILWGQTVYFNGQPYGLSVDPVQSRLYVFLAAQPDPANPRQVAVYRLPETGPSLLATISVGAGGPNGGTGIAVNPSTHHVLVTNSLANSLTVIHAVSLVVLRTTSMGSDPHAVAVDPGLGYVFVGQRAGNSVRGLPDY